MGKSVAMNIDWSYWSEELRHGMAVLLTEPTISKSLEAEHIKKTPERFVAALKEYLSGYELDPAEILRGGFDEKKHDQMVLEVDIPFISHCMHHVAPFFGKVHFGYIPAGRIVGLSKIPRTIEALSRRLQIQERLSDEIVDVFQEVVEPKGCGVVIEARHFCVCARGIRSTGSVTKTQALRGDFRDGSAKQEFLYAAKSYNGSALL